MTEEETLRLIKNEEELKLKFKHLPKKGLMRLLMSVKIYFPQEFSRIFSYAYKVILILLFISAIGCIKQPEVEGYIVTGKDFYNAKGVVFYHLELVDAIDTTIILDAYVSPTMYDLYNIGDTIK